MAKKKIDLDELESEIEANQTNMVWADVVLDLIAELREYRKLVVAAQRYKESADAWASSESPIEINPLTGGIYFRRSPELYERDERWAKLSRILESLSQHNYK